MKYISLLRGINVSGQKKILMVNLKSLYENLGFTNVTTYIQSGNVIFDSAEKNATKLKQKIESEIEKNFNFGVPVEIRTNSELHELVDNYPFSDINSEVNGSKILVTFLSKKPDSQKFCDIEQYASESETLDFQGREIYLYCPNGYGKTKLTNSLIEKKLGVSSTTRNWKTVIKLLELSC